MLHSMTIAEEILAAHTGVEAVDHCAPNTDVKRAQVEDGV